MKRYLLVGSHKAIPNESADSFSVRKTPKASICLKTEEHILKNWSIPLEPLTYFAYLILQLFLNVINVALALASNGPISIGHL